MTRYVLRYSRKYTIDGYVPVQERTHYLHKNVTRSSQGLLNTRVTDDINQARSWATLEGIDGYLARNLSSDLGSSWDIEEVAA
jgi:hypothetical protein